jgi:metacaspase-1
MAPGNSRYAPNCSQKPRAAGVVAASRAGGLASATGVARGMMGDGGGSSPSTTAAVSRGSPGNTRNAVLAGIRKASSTLGSGDFFMLTFSGHGGQVDDVSGEDEDDKKDETWCLWDSQLIDDELYFELSKFAAGVRVLILSDSCHSGTVARNGPPPPDEMGLRKRMMPRAVAMRTYLQHRKFYDGLQNHIANAAGKAKLSDPDAVLAALSVQSGRVQAVVKRFRAAVILISGCQDNQSSYDGDQNGAFTGQLLTTWNNGRFAGNYAKLHAQIVAAMPARQTPNLFLLGQAGAFVDETPFTP